MQQLPVKKGVKHIITASNRPKQTCALLTLAGEFCNRIYGFAAEETDDSVLPHLLPRNASDSVTTGPSPASSRNFFHLTQACYQIREEYRPLWLRASHINIQLGDLQGFLKTFYPATADYANGPSKLWLSWSHDSLVDKDELAYVEITQLLLLRAHHPATRLQFYPHEIAEADEPAQAFLDYFCTPEGYLSSDLDDEAREEWAYKITQVYGLTDSLNNLLNHNNDIWFEDIRRGRVSEVHILAQLWSNIDVFITVASPTSTNDIAKRIKFNGSTAAEALLLAQRYGFQASNLLRAFTFKPRL
ncbi:hypothetical protein BDV96DRAFT_655673 [Lophiotrema nucula]|uniref:Uncharacterized protein n=1 Tax=Lophiotrema nucula TaxID=690887 RepID=A0A6A5YFB2_9PLEO|nr:hypothetical protein BDV96DRAFT_655673 [Lophiotrema nucula]